MNKNEKNKAIKEIKKVWNKAEYVLNNTSWNKYGVTLLRESRQESQRHDNGRPSHIRRGMTITEESKFFAVKRLCEFLYDLEDAPSLNGFHHTQTSVYYAYSLAKEYADKLKEYITLEEAQYLNSLDYCELIKEVA